MSGGDDRPAAESGGTDRSAGNRAVMLRLVAIMLVMGGLAWASVPLYDLFCRVTGFGGATVTASENRGVALDDTVEIRFDASLERDMPWHFRPEQRTMTVRLGETNLAFYRAENPTDRPVAGSASFNVAPFSAGAYFTKIDCFCFEEQVLQPGEAADMPVTFYVDPAILDDADASRVPTITLSYTFHEIPLPEEQAALGDID